MNNALLLLGGLFAASFLAALTYATAVGGQALAKWLHAKGDNSIVARESAILDDLALGIVQDIESNEKSVLEARAAGPLTAADFVQLKNMAMTRLKTILQAKGLDTLQKMLGAVTANPPVLDSVLSGTIEKAVAKVSAGAVASTAAALTATPVSPR